MHPFSKFKNTSCCVQGYNGMNYLLDTGNSCKNPFCMYCFGKQSDRSHCVGPSNDLEDLDDRTCEDLVKQGEPSLEVKCGVEKQLAKITRGRNFWRIPTFYSQLPFKDAMSDFFRSYPSLVNNKYLSAGPHQFAWYLKCIIDYTRKHR